MGITGNDSRENYLLRPTLVASDMHHYGNALCSMKAHIPVVLSGLFRLKKLPSEAGDEVNESSESKSKHKLAGCKTRR